MAYVSLYRKYRPQTFDEVVGQEHVTTTLANAIEEDRLHHAYLFTGPRGTGKTSTARILAKAVNCEQGPTATPCNACGQCEAITAGSSVDVIELDMASHGGVDDARDLRERARFAPASARRKLYILDEVHMASTAAFNALLKLIEEPPDHVIFAMATTDPQKVVPTVMSRVQRFDLRRIPAGRVAAHVRHICEAEGYEIEDGAVQAVVRAGDGSVRDALSVLEQVLSFAGRTVTTEAVTRVLGQTPFDRTSTAVEAVVAGDLGAAMTLVQELQDEGTDLRRFTFDLLQHLRDLLVLGAAPDRPDLVDATDERRAELVDQAGRVSQETLLHAVDVLAEAVTEMRLGPPRLPLELALATLATPSVSPDLTGLADRVARLERSLGEEREGTGEMRSEAAPAGGSDDTVPAEAGPREPGGERERDHGGATGRGAGQDPAEPDRDDIETIRERWGAILEVVKDVSRRVHAVYEPAEPLRLRNRVLTLRYPKRYASFHADNAGKGQYSEPLVAAVERATGLRVRIEAVVEGDEARRPQPPLVTAEDDPPPEIRPAPDPDEAPGEAMARAERLIVDELDAVRVDEGG